MERYLTHCLHSVIGIFMSLPACPVFPLNHIPHLLVGLYIDILSYWFESHSILPSLDFLSYNGWSTFDAYQSVMWSIQIWIN